MKKKIEENPLPSVESAHFMLYSDAMYWIDDMGAKHKITKAGVCANGVRDLCIYWHGPTMDDVRIGKIAEVPKDHIRWIPKGDILWMRFEPPLADGKLGLFFDTADPAIKDIVREIFQRFGGEEKGSDYDMFGGEQYE